MSKKVKEKKDKVQEVEDVDAQLGGYPAPGVLVGPGPGVLGDGVTTWYGYTRWRFKMTALNGDGEYVADAFLIAEVEKEHPEIDPPKFNRVRDLVRAAPENGSKQIAKETTP